VSRAVHTEPALALALELADLADEITLARFRAQDLVVETKPDLTPVSEADKAVEKALRAHLEHHATGHAILGEEYGDDGADATFRWVIDPIDGTKNYVRGVPIWATLIAFERDGDGVVGVVSAPALGARWWASLGAGAHHNGRPIRVSAVHAIEDAQLSFAWDTRERFEADGLGERLLRLSHACWRTRGIGDFWQHLLVADGSFDIAVEPIVARWDIAALLPILREAGGRWTDLAGGTDETGAHGFVASNGLLHETVLQHLQPERP
jgi:histidinol-phosphatase